MKKLMIAAASAAMIGGAFANLSDWGVGGTAYNATITLKTTVGKTKTATTTYYLGKDSRGYMWYEQDSIRATINADLANTTAGFVHKFTTKKVAGVSVPVLTKAGKEDSATLFLVKQLATTDKTGRNSDLAICGYKSANKWCDSFSEKGEYCYRTAGTVKTSGIFVDDCCATTLTSGATVGFVHAFGGDSYANSKKAEIYIDDVITAGLVLLDPKDDTGVTPAAVTDNLKYDRTITALAIAGQGSIGAVKDNDGNGATSTLSDEKGIVSISGSAVGTCDSVMCTSCCVSTGIAQEVWDCTGLAANNNETAAYGTFSLKYNASFTK